MATKKKEVAFLYARVSTQMQANDGMSLGAQERDLKRAAEKFSEKKVGQVSQSKDDLYFVTHLRSWTKARRLRCL
jgi:predicted site-specific integrase-resolvase